jgi:hypothetical protein
MNMIFHDIDLNSGDENQWMIDPLDNYKSPQELLDELTPKSYVDSLIPVPEKNLALMLDEMTPDISIQNTPVPNDGVLRPQVINQIKLHHLKPELLAMLILQDLEIESSVIQTLSYPELKIAKTKGYSDRVLDLYKGIRMCLNQNLIGPESLMYLFMISNLLLIKSYDVMPSDIDQSSLLSLTFLNYKEILTQEPQTALKILAKTVTIQKSVDLRIAIKIQTSRISKENLRKKERESLIYKTWKEAVLNMCMYETICYRRIIENKKPLQCRYRNQEEKVAHKLIIQHLARGGAITNQFLRETMDPKILETIPR